MAASQHTDASHQTVIRWERRTAGAMLSESRKWYSHYETALKSEVPTLQWANHCVRMDATNKRVLHKQSLVVCAVRSSYRLPNEKTETREIYSDVLFQSGHSAAHALGHARKQMSNTGCPTWADALELYNAHVIYDKDGIFTQWKLDSKLNCRSVYAFTTDAGPDERACRDKIAYMVAQCPGIYFYELNCTQHQLHLIAKGLLSSSDLFVSYLIPPATLPSASYYSNLACLSNCMREYSAKLTRTWLELFPDTTLRMASKLPPRCIANRWASTIRFQRFFSKGFIIDYDQ